MARAAVRTRDIADHSTDRHGAHATRTAIVRRAARAESGLHGLPATRQPAGGRAATRDRKISQES